MGISLQEVIADSLKSQIGKRMAAVLDMLEEASEKLFRAATLSAEGEIYIMV